MKSERRLSLSFSELGCDLTIVSPSPSSSSTTAINEQRQGQGQQQANNSTTSTSRSTSKRVHFADDDVITYHDGPVNDEIPLVYDTRSEAQVLHEARQEHQHLLVDGQLSGYTAYAQALETLYRKKGNNRRCSTMIATATTTTTTDDKNKDSTTTTPATFHNELHRMLLPRHFEWALRSITASEWRGLELVTAAGLISAQRRHVVQQVLQVQQEHSMNATTLAKMAAAQTQHSTFLAMLLGKGDYEQIIDATTTTMSPSSHRRPIRSPAA